MSNKTIIVNGYEYNATDGIIMCMLYVAQDHSMELSDYLFSSIIQEFEEDEDKVMEQMAESKSPSFTRHSTGWYVTD